MACNIHSQITSNNVKRNTGVSFDIVAQQTVSNNTKCDAILCI